MNSKSGLTLDIDSNMRGVVSVKIKMPIVDPVPSGISADGAAIIGILQRMPHSYMSVSEVVTSRNRDTEQEWTPADHGSHVFRSQWLDLASACPAAGVADGRDLYPYLTQDFLHEEVAGLPGQILVTAKSDKEGWTMDETWAVLG